MVIIDNDSWKWNFDTIITCCADPQNNTTSHFVTVGDADVLQNLHNSIAIDTKVQSNGFDAFTLWGGTAAAHFLAPDNHLLHMETALSGNSIKVPLITKKQTFNPDF